MEIPRHEQGLADQAQVAPLLSVLAALGQGRPLVEAVDAGRKIRRVVEQATQIDPDLLDEGSGQVLLDGGDADNPLVDAEIRTAVRRATGGSRLYNLVRTGYN
jgi:hypothetical protein